MQDVQTWALGWGYKTKSWPIDSALANFAAFGYTFPKKIISNPKKKFSSPWVCIWKLVPKPKICWKIENGMTKNIYNIEQEPFGLPPLMTNRHSQFPICTDSLYLKWNITPIMTPSNTAASLGQGLAWCQILHKALCGQFWPAHGRLFYPLQPQMQTHK